MIENNLKNKSNSVDNDIIYKLVQYAKIIEELKRIYVREILIGRRDQLAARASRDRRFDIRRKQTQARLLNEADRKAKRTAGINVLLQLVYEFDFTVVGVEVGFHSDSSKAFPFYFENDCPIKC